MNTFPFFIHEAGDIFISERIRRTGVWEPFESRLLLSLLRRGDQVIDVGANIGWYTVSAARQVGDAGHVFAFEPDARNFALLSANVHAGGLSWVSLERSALGRSSGSAVIRHLKDNQGDHRVRAFVTGEIAPNSTRDIPVVALDEYLAQRREFDVAKLRIIKIDVQGFEREVLLGAQRLLSALPAQTICFIEFDPILLRDNDPAACGALIDNIASMRREIFAIVRPIWRVKKLTISKLRQAARPERSYSFDLILVHRERLRDLRRALPIVPRLLSAAALLIR
jgi:FkbM family methyltransferase